MEKQGLSLFEGKDCLEIDPNLTNHDEDDEEDQKRRNEELQDLVKDAFDDLLGDDIDLSSVNSSLHSHQAHLDSEGAHIGNPIVSQQVAKEDSQQYSLLEGTGDNPQFSHYYTQSFQRSPFEEKNGVDQKKDYDSKKLEVLYEARVREVHRLNEQLEQLREKAAYEKDQLYRKFALSEAEKERVQLLYTQCHEQLGTKSARVLELEEELQAVKGQKNVVEVACNRLSGELKAAQYSIQDLEKKVSVIQCRRRNSQEVTVPASQAIVEEFNAREDQFQKLHQELKDLRLAHGILMVEKNSIIDKLTADLEENKQQYQELIKNMDNEKIIVERDELQNEVKKLKMELRTVRNDLRNYESFTKLNSDDSDAFFTYQKVNATNDLNIKLREELQRCLSGLKIKREEIKELKNQLEERDKLINKLQNQEKAYLEEADNLQSEFDKAKSDNNRLQEELIALKQQSVEEKLKAINKHKEEYIQWHDGAVARIKQEANQQIQKTQADFSIRLEQKEKECVEVKELYIEVCSSKEKLLKSLEQEQQKNREFIEQLNIQSKKLQGAEMELQAQKTKLYGQFQNSCENEDLKKTLKMEKDKVTSLELEIESAREHEKHCTEILAKAVERAKLETQNALELKYKQCIPSKTEVATSPLKSEVTKKDDMSNILAELETRHQEEMTKILAKLNAQHQAQIERVKQESVQCLANELSACEARHRQQLEQAEEEYSRNLASFRGLIDTKTQEVEALKKAMLEERDKLKAARENSQISEELKYCSEEIEYLERLKSCEKDFMEKLEIQSSEWRSKLVDYQKEVEEERSNIAQTVADWAAELQSLQKKCQEYEVKIEELNQKYKSAKKTAYCYKKWADGKEKHIAQEWCRITLAFQKAFEALKAKAETEGDSIVAKQIEAELKELQDKMTSEVPR